MIHQFYISAAYPGGAGDSAWIGLTSFQNCVIIVSIEIVTAHSYASPIGAGLGTLLNSSWVGSIEFIGNKNKITGSTDSTATSFSCGAVIGGADGASASESSYVNFIEVQGGTIDVIVHHHRYGYVRTLGSGYRNQAHSVYVRTTVIKGGKPNLSGGYLGLATGIERTVVMLMRSESRKPLL